MNMYFQVENLDAAWGNNEQDVEKAGKAYQQYGQYCKLKAFAMRERKAGQIQTALDIERKCDQIYNSLPTWARW